MKALINEAVNLVQGIQSENDKLTSKCDKFSEDIKQGMLGSKGIQLQREALREEIQSLQGGIRNKANDLLDKIEASEQRELEQLVLNAESVNADNVAELQLLKGLDTTAEELQRYAKKYHNNPLAIKTLKQIAKDKEILATFPETEQSKTIKKYSKLKTLVTTYQNFYVNAVGVQKARQDTTLGMHLETLKNM